MRILLILLLTCSQAIAPALHAHVGGEHYGDGAHLHNVLASAHAANAGADIESIEGRVIGVALSLVSRTWKIAAPVPRDANTPPDAALAANITDSALPLRTAGPHPLPESSIQSLRSTPYFQPQWRGPPTA